MAVPFKNLAKFSVVPELSVRYQTVMAWFGKSMLTVFVSYEAMTGFPLESTSGTVLYVVFVVFFFVFLSTAVVFTATFLVPKIGVLIVLSLSFAIRASVQFEISPLKINVPVFGVRLISFS